MAVLSTKEEVHDLLATLGECRIPGEDRDFPGFVKDGSRKMVRLSSSPGLGKQGLVRDFKRGPPEDEVEWNPLHGRSLLWKWWWRWGGRGFLKVPRFWGEGGAVEEGRGGNRGAQTGQEGDLQISNRHHIRLNQHAHLLKGYQRKL